MTLTLTPRQQVIFDGLVTDLANRAASSDLPYAEYHKGLSTFIFAGTAERVRLMKTNNKLFTMMKFDEGKLINMLAELRSASRNYMTDLLEMLDAAVRAEL